MRFFKSKKDAVHSREWYLARNYLLVKVSLLFVPSHYVPCFFFSCSLSHLFSVPSVFYSCSKKVPLLVKHFANEFTTEKSFLQNPKQLSGYNFVELSLLHLSHFPSLVSQDKAPAIPTSQPNHPATSGSASSATASANSAAAGLSPPLSPTSTHSVTNSSAAATAGTAYSLSSQPSSQPPASSSSPQAFSHDSSPSFFLQGFSQTSSQHSPHFFSQPSQPSPQFSSQPSPPDPFRSVPPAQRINVLAPSDSNRMFVRFGADGKVS